jgi:UPF0716 family protein affecting phage T7 exclusion
MVPDRQLSESILSMDKVWLAAFFPLLLGIIGSCIGLLVLYGIIRVAVSRGLRDHQKWMERYRPADSRMPYPDGYRPISPAPPAY